MAYATISNWVTTEWNGELVSLAQDKFVPLILSCGAQRVQMIRTGDVSFSVVTEYVDEAAALAAQERITAIRAQAADELPMTLESANGGGVFAGS